ncbi:MAG: GPR endopeptidase [Clostridia bacterium]|nr:GPR endopeptidase [Clostridia bacterium]
MQIRTDLAMESREFLNKKSGVSSYIFQHGKIEEIHVHVETKEAAKILMKDCGKYITLTYPNLLYQETGERKELVRILAETIRHMIPAEGDILIIGLGNRHITADALGSRVLDHLMVTRHMSEIAMPGLKGKLRSVCAVAPGVLGITGIETAEMVHGIVEKIHPSAVIAIDALAARECSRICSTIQITDTGIRPGSGVGNHRQGLNRETLGVPVIAIGVPMVVYASVIARDALAMMMKDIGMNEDEHQSAIDVLIRRVADDGMGDLVVTPREVDDLVGRVGRIIADGINKALHERLTDEEIAILSNDHLV